MWPRDQIDEKFFITNLTTYTYICMYIYFIAKHIILQLLKKLAV